MVVSYQLSGMVLPKIYVAAAACLLAAAGVRSAADESRCVGGVDRFSGFPCVETGESRSGGAGSISSEGAYRLREPGGTAVPGCTSVLRKRRRSRESQNMRVAHLGILLKRWGTQRVRVQLTFASRKLEMVKEAYEDATAKLEDAKAAAVEAASAARLGRRMYDFLQQKRRALAAALKKMDVKRKLLEIDQLLKLSRALKEIGDRIGRCEVTVIAPRPAERPPEEEGRPEKSQVFGSMVEDKSRVLEEEATLLSKLLGREAVAERFKKIEDDLQQGAKRVEAKVQELRGAVERAAAKTKDEIEAVSAEAGRELKQGAAGLRRAASEALSKSHQALIDVVKALQRSLLEEQAKRLVEAAKEEVAKEVGEKAAGSGIDAAVSGVGEDAAGKR
ncbi:cyst matrix protein [Cystoisospora suis]|uniref:Cyst matrix protein n=1 Tax=Cystoisospora suis TaxID=483139 RepID=A0A2C6KYL5_9APIC|nr:cyst matrix protein [Cystoisospora suis]